MKERPILFSAPMVRSLLNCTKSQTRRVLKHQPIRCTELPLILFPQSKNEAIEQTGYIWPNAKEKIIALCPYGKPGDRLWVREAHRMLDCTCTETCRIPGHVYYEADGGGYTGAFQGKLRPSIHMPRWASRITLEITGVRVERLNDISQADAIAEGAPPSHPSIDRVSSEYGHADFSRSWYAQLWEQINGAGSWGANPFVWVVEFRMVQP